MGALMAKDITAMAADLEAVIAKHVTESLTAVNTTAEQMATRVRALSSPEYGVAVQARTVEIPDGREVQTLVRATNGPGHVFGGQSAVRTQVAKVIDSTAKEGGLDRRR